MDHNFQKYFSDSVTKVRDLDHQGNNKLYEVTTEKGRFLLKQYSDSSQHGWKRGENESTQISLLWGLGFREIPRLVSFTPSGNVAVYSFIPGRVLEQKEVSKENMVQLAYFAAKMHNIGDEHKAKVNLSKTFSLSIADYLGVLDMRVAQIKSDFEGSSEARDFFYNEVLPKVEKVKKSILDQTSNPSIQLPLSKQAIVHGDFGVHNLIVDQDKKGTVVDFEYSSRDDPLKDIFSVLHHHKHQEIPLELKKLFLDTYLSQRPNAEALAKKIKLLNPWAIMEWVLIYLNPFSKQYAKHMSFSQGVDDIEEIRKIRLERASNRLESLTI
ncbi:MAG: aminoglycoside phosphotransferase family protein [archaeon]